MYSVLESSPHEQTLVHNGGEKLEPGRIRFVVDGATDENENQLTLVNESWAEFDDEPNRAGDGVTLSHEHVDGGTDGRLVLDGAPVWVFWEHLAERGAVINRFRL